MITLQELIDYLTALFEGPITSDYCPNGLQVEGKASIKKVATAVTASRATIEAAVAADVDALIVHHGLFWKGDEFPIIGAKKGRLEPLFRYDISLFGYHLPLDAHPEIGNNWRAARDLGWEQLEPFGVLNGAPIGVRGTFAPMDRDSFKKKLESYYDHPATEALGGPEQVSSAALVSGGAYGLIKEAAEVGADCFVTGNFDEPAWHLAHEEGVNFYAMGHSATERVGPRALAERLSALVPTEFLDVPNPF